MAWDLLNVLSAMVRSSDGLIAHRSMLLRSHQATAFRTAATYALTVFGRLPAAYRYSLYSDNRSGTSLRMRATVGESEWD